MRIALFKDFKYNYETVSKEGTFEGDKTYVRISEVVDVDFPMLTTAETVQNQLSALDEMRAEVSTKFAAMLKEIDERKASLQALTHEVAA